MAIALQEKKKDIGQESQIQHIKYSRDVVHKHSKAIQKLFNLVLTYVEDAEKECEKGKNVIWGGGLWESLIVYAGGGIPVLFGEMGRVSSKEALIIAENYFQLPAETCSMVKATMGEWYLRKDKGIKRICGNSGFCEPFNQAFEIIKKEGYDVYNVDVVYRAPGVAGERYEQLLEYLISEIHDFNRWLNHGKEIDKARLLLEIKRKNYILHKIRRIMDLRIKHPFYVRSLAVMYLLNGTTHYFGKPEEYTQVVDDLLVELEAAPEHSDELKEAIPLVWAGGNGQEFGVYEAIDEANGALLGFVVFPYAIDYDESIDPVEAVARYVLGSQMAGASVYYRDAIDNQINKVGARGLLLYGYLGCSFGSIQKEIFRDFFHNKGIPSINLEGTFQVGPPTGQLLTRVKAFVEMLS